MRQSELIIDSFAGGGGASLGIAWALGRGPDIAVNHDAAALAMHEVNHPSTRHVHEDVWKADLRKLVGSRKVGLLWASPDCKHFSRAKGGKPVEKQIRSLAWIVCRWAVEVRPRLIVLENVREFADWGPLGSDDRPCPRRKGLTFRRFIGRLRNLGYDVQWRNLDAADYGAPTHRRRLFLIARCDGQPIEWPEPTHVDPAKLNDQPLFNQPLPWRTAAECIDWELLCPSIFDRVRPLAEKTMKRIALGIKRYVLENPRPFIAPVTHVGERRVHPINEPLPTVTSAKRGELALISPTLSKYHGQKANESRCNSVDEPFRTLDTQNRYGLVQAFLAKHFGGMVGVPVDTPFPTITQTPTQNQIVAANLVRFNFDDAGVPISHPLPTVTISNHAALVYSFLMKYFGTAIGANLTRPCPTATSKDRFGLVTVQVEGQPYVIVDIGMRMLAPRELARAQGFPDTYVLTGTKTNQVARIGNSVCPIMAKVLVESNFAYQEVR